MSVPDRERSSSESWALAATLMALALALLGLMAWESRRLSLNGGPPSMTAEPPPELAPFAAAFREGVDALGAARPERAIELLSSFSFGERPVEQYRLYYLARANELAGRKEEARRTFARLWRERPNLAYAPQIAMSLGGLYAENGSDHRAAEVFGAIATRTEDPAISAAAREKYLEARFRTGDLGAVLLASYNLIVESPAAPQSQTARAIARAIQGLPGEAPIPLTPAQTIRHGEALLDSERPKAALEVLSRLETAGLSERLQHRSRLARGEAQARLGQHKASEETLDPLFASPYTFAIPALELSARNRRAMADAIKPVDVKTVKVQERAGTRLVTRKGKKVRVPNYRTAFKKVETTNASKKAERDRQEAVYEERLLDLRSLPIDEPLEKDVLTRLVARAVQAKDEAKVRLYLAELTALDPSSDAELQSFWDRGWGAYAGGDPATAADLFSFIASTYRSPNIRRQSTYWYARSIEKSGKTAEAQRIYRELAQVPYEDLYSLYAKIRLGDEFRIGEIAAPPPRVSWEEMAEARMPPELRLAYELNALGVHRDARIEVQRNASHENRKWADAILGELFFAEGAQDSAYRYMRRAWPELATPEQNSVPWRFLQMYYPLRYEEEIRKAAEENDLDPYLVMALIRQESAFNPDARSSVGAIGLMQIMPATGRELGNRLYKTFNEARLSNPEVNLELGSHYLKRVLNLLDNQTQIALAGYNGGPYRMRRWRKEKPNQPLDEFLEGMPLSETRNYVKRITLLRSSYEQLYGPTGTVEDPQFASR